MSPADGAWLHPEDPAPEAGVRLFLLHHSGGSAAFYHSWPGLLPPDVAVQRVQLPGRLERANEDPYTELAPLVTALVRALSAALDSRPYALFGHSMGALLAYRSALELARTGEGPALLAVSGWAPEGFAGPDRERLRGLDDDEVWAATCELGLLPASAAADPEARASIIRLMRADTAVCADYRDDGAAVACPVAAYAGLADPLLEPGAMHAWASRTPRFLGTRIYPGDHFYLREHAAAVAADLSLLIPREG